MSIEAGQKLAAPEKFSSRTGETDKDQIGLDTMMWNQFRKDKFQALDFSSLPSQKTHSYALWQYAEVFNMVLILY